MKVTMLGRHGIVVLAPGRYWFGDPCYGLSDEGHMSLLDKGYTPVRGIDRDGRQGLVGQTRYGDGRFFNEESGATLGVDSGQLAILHESMLDGKDIDGGEYVELPQGARATFGDGLFEVKGAVSVDTSRDGDGSDGDEDEEEAEDEDVI